MEFLRAATAPLASHGGAVRARAAVSWRMLIAAGLLALVAGVALFDIVAGEHRASLPVAHGQSAPRRGLTALPSAAQGLVSAAVGADGAGYSVTASGGGLRAQNAAQGLRVRFDSAGVQVRSASTQLGLSLRAVGYGASLHAVGPVRPSAKANRVTYTRSGLSEWYANGPLGLEQGFTIPRPPSVRSTGPLTLQLALSGNAPPVLSGGSIALSHGGNGLRYAGLSVSDATGRVLHSWLVLQAGRVLIRVQTKGARFPLRIDPFVQQGGKLTGSGESGKGEFGYSVALSEDGNTALIGGGADNRVGAAWVFTRSGEKWTQQGAKLTGGGESGEGKFGESVALSADGNTALIGGYRDESGSGAAWVFTRSGEKWTQQGAKLTGGGESGEGHFGYSVALSQDGNTALIGGGGDSGRVGAAWVFTRSGETWTQQGAKLTGSGESGEGKFGVSVALSADGNVALIGGYTDGGGIGAAWVFTRSGETWTQQGAKLTGGAESGEGEFGESVALSADGNTALIGGYADGGGIGAAWVFTRSGETWTQQGSKLTGGAESGDGHFGYSVALAEDGHTALIGGGGDSGRVGAAWVFTRSGETWTQQGAKLTGSGESGAGEFGDSVALSADDNIALIGGPRDLRGIGAAWAFVSGPTVTGVSPNSGPVAGGTQVTITGIDLSRATAVYFGTAEATEVQVTSGEIIAVSPPGNSTGTVDVTLTTPEGASSTSSADQFTYQAAPTAITAAASPVGQASATLNATVNPEGAAVSDCHFEYGASPSYGFSVPCSSLPGSGSSPVPVSASVAGLSVNTTYYFRIVATNPDGTGYGSEQSFSTLPPNPPGVVTGAASSVASTTATLNATVNPEGAAVSDCHFEYGASPSYGFSVPCSSLPGSGSSPVPVSASVAGLSVNTAYYFRIVATNPDGTSYGSEQSFKTPLAPTVLTGGASSLGQTSATLNATVNPNEEAVSDCHFEYGASPSYGSSVPCSSLPGSGSSPVPVSAPVAGLSANTIYYFRIVASNPGGTSYGNEQTFMTAAPELPELGRCLKLAGKAVGEFTTAACTIKSTGENTGRYEWEPWPLAKNHFSVKGGAATFETAGKATVKCLQNTYAGEYTGSQAATVTIIFAGCQASGALGGKCQSEAAQAGEIIASPLEGKLGVIKAVPTPSVGWDLKPVSQPDLATFKCGESAMSVAGSVIAPVTALDKMATTFKLKYKATKGKQAPENFEAGLKDTLSFLTESAEEQAGLTMADSIVNEEAVEIKAIV